MTDRFDDLRLELDGLVEEAGERVASEIRRAIRDGEAEFADVAERIALTVLERVLASALADIGGTQTGGAQGEAVGIVSDLITRGSRFI